MHTVYKYILLLIILLYSTNAYSSSLRIAFLNLKQEGISDKTADVVLSMLKIRLINSNKFNIINEKHITDILKRQSIEQKDCTAQDCIKKIGKLISADKILIGDVGKEDISIIVTIRIIDIAGEENEKVITENVSNISAEEIILKLIKRIEEVTLKEIDDQIDITGKKQIPAGISISYALYIPATTPFYKYYINLHGGSLTYISEINEYVSYQVSTFFVLGIYKNLTETRTLLNSYAFGLRLGIPIYRLLYPYIGVSGRLTWIREMGENESADFLGTGADGFAGACIIITNNFSLFFQYNYIWTKVQDDRGTNISGSFLSTGIMYRI